MWIEIFKTGTWTDSNGNTRTWTEEDLDKIASSYKPGEHEAPVVIGHPKDNAPAWGWVEALKREGNVLKAKLKQLVPEFVDMVRRGLFKKRSISLYPDLKLRHIGFLGAQPPAVKGLADVSFEDQDDQLDYEFEEPQQGVFMQTKTQPESGKDQNFAEFEEKMKALEAQLAAYQQELDARDQRIKSLQEKIDELERKRRQREFEQFAEALIKEGRLLPAQKEKVVGILLALDGAGTLNFGEQSIPLTQAFQELLQANPKQVFAGMFPGKPGEDDEPRSKTEKLASLIRNGK